MAGSASTSLLLSRSTEPMVALSSRRVKTHWPIKSALRGVTVKLHSHTKPPSFLPLLLFFSLSHNINLRRFTTLRFYQPLHFPFLLAFYRHASSGLTIIQHCTKASQNAHSHFSISEHQAHCHQVRLLLFLVLLFSCPSTSRYSTLSMPILPAQQLRPTTSSLVWYFHCHFE